jgi:AraC-like DNA-binding protein
LKKARVLTGLIAAYCILFGIVACFQLFSATNTIRSIRRNEAEKTGLVLTQYANHVDSIFTAIQGINTGLKHNEHLLHLPFWGKSADENAYVNLRDELSRLCFFYNTYLDNIYIFNSKDASVVSAVGKVAQQVFSQSEHAYYQDVFFSADLSSNSFVYQKADQEGYLYFFTQLRANAQGQYTNAMYIVRLADINEGFYAGGTGGTFGIFSLTDGRFIGENGVLSVFQEQIRHAHLKGGLKTCMHLAASGADFEAYAVESSVSPLVYAISTPGGYTAQVMQRFVHQTLWMSAAFMAVMLLVIVTMIWFQYTPIKNILRMIGANGTGGQNEYDLIRQYVGKMKVEYVNYENKLKSHVSHIENWFYGQLISNPYITQSYVSEIMETYGIRFVYSHFVVATIELLNVSMDAPDAEDQSELRSNYSLLMFALENIINEQFSPWAQCRMVDNRGTIACIVNFSGRTENAMARVVECFVQIWQFVNKHLNIDCKAFIGSMQDDVMKINRSYQHVMDVVFYKNHLKLDSIFVYDDFKNLPERELRTMLTDDARYKFMLAIKTGNEAAAKTLLTSLCEKAADGTWIVKRRLLSDFFDMMQAEYASLELHEPQIEALFERFLKQYQNDSMFDQHVSDLAYLLQKLIAQINESSIPSAQMLIERINQYVQKHYDNAQINVSMIAEQFHISPNYLSTVYSDYSGGGLHAYITSVRIAKAKELLAAQGQWKIREVAQAVGYQNIRTFNRVFALECGVSPSEYRAANLQREGTNGEN